MGAPTTPFLSHKMNIFSPDYFFPPPHPHGGEGGESGGGGASGSWGFGECSVVAAPVAAMIALLIPWIGFPAAGPAGEPFEMEDGSEGIWVGAYLYYTIDAVTIYSIPGEGYESSRRGTLCTVWDNVRLCEGTQIGDKLYSYCSSYEADRENDIPLGSGVLWYLSVSPGWQGPEGMLEYCKTAPPFVDYCAQQAIFRLFCGLYAWPVPFFNPTPVLPFLPVLPGLPVEGSGSQIEGVVPVFMAIASAQQARKRKKRSV